MHVRVLKPFPYSGDGVRLETLRAGEEVDIRGDLAPGLTAEGYVVPAERTVELPVDNAPDDAFDHATADADALRAFLAERGLKPHHKTGEDKLREMAAAELAKE